MRALIVFISAISFQQAAGAQDIKPVRVAIIDTGIASIPILKERLVASYDLGGNRGRLASKHGTVVASIIALNVERPIEFLSYRIDSICISSWCEMPADRIGAAVRSAVKEGVSIIQISSYGVIVGEARKALIAAARSGVHIVVAAGNQAGTTPYLSLMRDAGANFHVIGSLNSRGVRSSWSAKGEGVQWRPGEDLKAYDDKGRTSLVEGTSFAASIFTAELIGRSEYAFKTAAAADMVSKPKTRAPAPTLAEHQDPSIADDAIAAPMTVEIQIRRSRAMMPDNLETAGDMPALRAANISSSAPLKSERSRAIPPR